MVAANSVQARLESSRGIPRIIPSSASVNGRPQNARPSPIVTGIASDLLHAGSHAYVTGIFRESPENSSPRTSRMYKLQGAVHITALCSARDVPSHGRNHLDGAAARRDGTGARVVVAGGPALPDLSRAA